MRVGGCLGWRGETYLHALYIWCFVGTAFELAFSLVGLFHSICGVSLGVFERIHYGHVLYGVREIYHCAVGKRKWQCEHLDSNGISDPRKSNT